MQIITSVAWHNNALKGRGNAEHSCISERWHNNLHVLTSSHTSFNRICSTRRLPEKPWYHKSIKLSFYTLRGCFIRANVVYIVDIAITWAVVSTCSKSLKAQRYTQSDPRSRVTCSTLKSRDWSHKRLRGTNQLF